MTYLEQKNLLYSQFRNNYTFKLNPTINYRRSFTMLLVVAELIINHLSRYGMIIATFCQALQFSGFQIPPCLNFLFSSCIFSISILRNMFSLTGPLIKFKILILSNNFY